MSANCGSQAFKIVCMTLLEPLPVGDRWTQKLWKKSLAEEPPGAKVTMDGSGRG